jgi:hypothetical protein
MYVCMGSRRHRFELRVYVCFIYACYERTVCMYVCTYVCMGSRRHRFELRVHVCVFCLRVCILFACMYVLCVSMYICGLYYACCIRRNLRTYTHTYIDAHITCVHNTHIYGRMYGQPSPALRATCVCIYVYMNSQSMYAAIVSMHIFFICRNALFANMYVHVNQHG